MKLGGIIQSGNTVRSGVALTGQGRALTLRPNPRGEEAM
jgi:hypothetical protein